MFSLMDKPTFNSYIYILKKLLLMVASLVGALVSPAYRKKHRRSVKTKRGGTTTSYTDVLAETSNGLLGHNEYKVFKAITQD